MNRAINPRWLILLLVALNAAWMFSAGSQLVGFVHDSHKSWHGFSGLSGYLHTLVLVFLVRSFQWARAPEMARAARIPLGNLVGVLELVGLAMALAGAIYGPLEFNRTSVAWWSPMGISSFIAFTVAIPPIAVIASRAAAPLLPEPPVVGRHIADRDATRCLLSLVLLFGTQIAAIWMVMPSQAQWTFPFGWSFLPPAMLWVGYGVAAGLAIVAAQPHWHRGLGFAPWAFLMLSVGIVGHAASPRAMWPGFLIGMASMGLPHLLAALSARLPMRRRFWILLMTHLGVGVVAMTWGVVLALALRAEWHARVLLAASLVGGVIVTNRLFRSFVELINEMVFRVLWFPHAFGPGVAELPTRGPILVIANHAAMFDPVWLAAVVPLPLRSMMLSTFMDRPFLKWLTGRVYRSIRVPAETFRRSMPEIDEAVAAIRQGDSVLIFPEAWLRRKEEQPLRRFANGVHRILAQVPQTPVVACWIEDGWGSYTSYKGGPPGVKKKFDLLRRIRIGISRPEILPADILADDIATRRHLMQAVLNARTYLGLPAHGMPPFGDDKPEPDLDHGEQKGTHDDHAV